MSAIRSNPFFRPTRPALSRHVVVVMGVGVLLAVMGYAVTRPMFWINTVNVQGGGTDMQGLLQQDVERWLDTRWAHVVPRRHRWFLQPQGMERRLLNTFPLNAVDVRRQGTALSISVIEKIRQYLVLQDDVLYAVDRTGSVIEPLSDVERMVWELDAPMRIPTIRYMSSVPLKVGDTVFSETQFEQMVSAIDTLQSATLLSPVEIFVVEDQRRLTITTDAGVDIYLALDRDMRQQIAKLELLISRKLVDINTLTYIDLRYDHRLFYH